MLEKIKKENPVSLFLKIGSALIAILGFIAILEENGILPQNTFKKLFFILVTIYIIAVVIVCLLNFLPLYYINAQLKGFKSSENSIYLSIHSLNSESTKYKYKLFNNAIEKAKKRKIDVKILAPCGTERILGAYEMCVEHKLIDNMRFNPQLEDENLRYTLIDDSIILISQQKIPSKKLSRKYAYIKSERLNELLKKYFDEMWSKETTIDFNQYLKNVLDDLGTTKSDPTSIKIALERTGIPEDYLIRFLNQGTKY